MFIERFKIKDIFSLIIIIFLMKFFIFIAYQFNISLFLTGGGSDANYYNCYAKGECSHAVNIWPVLLRFLNEHGLYDRKIISNILFFISVVVIPSFGFFVCKKGRHYNNQKIAFFVFLLLSMYPTLFFYNYDVYRDIIMVFIWMLGLFFVKKTFESKYLNILYFLLFAIISYLLFLFRPYLGFAFFISYPFSFLFIKIKKWHYIFMLYLFLMNLFFYFGLFDPLVKYRSGFEELSGGSTIGIDFKGVSYFSFIPYFIISYITQFFGVYFINLGSVILFLFESLPIIFLLRYIVKNYVLNIYTSYLLSFVFIYNSVWVIANDNLGTAVRLRIYSYLALIFVALYMYLVNKDSYENSASSNRSEDN